MAALAPSVFLIRALIERTELEIWRLGSSIPIDPDVRERWQRQKERLHADLDGFHAAMIKATTHGH